MTVSNTGRIVALSVVLGLAGCASTPVTVPTPPAPVPVRPVPPPKPVQPPKPVAKPVPPPATRYLPTPPPVAQPQIAMATAVPAARALLDKARLARRQGLLPEADALLERALRLAPRDSELYLETALVRLQQKNFAAASQFAQKSLSMLGGADALSSRQQRLEAWGIIAESREALGDDAGAEKARLEVQRWQ